MDKVALDSLIEKIKKEQKGEMITPRNLFEAFDFYRRTSHNCSQVDTYLASREVVVEPHYNDVWIDTPIEIKDISRATRKCQKDPIQRIKVIEAAHRQPYCVQNDSTLDLAITLMQRHNITQLPVTDGNRRNLSGYVSWETIGNAKARGVDSNLVKDYKSTHFVAMSPEDSLLSAMETVYKQKFVIVVDKNEVVGIITKQDMASQFLRWTKPFILLEEIENQIRRLIECGNLSLRELQSMCKDGGKNVEHIEDLNFGDYVAIIGNEDIWNKIGLKCVDKTELTKALDSIREIRNDVIHFDPEGLTNEQCQELENMSIYLQKIVK